jgi:VanZ family protein
MKIMTVMAGIRERFAQFIPGKSTKIPKLISDHHARDIGLKGAELARHRFVWPSQSRDRPLL